MKTDKKIIKYQDLKKIRQTATKEGKTVVFTSGCYDLLHLGHIIHFNFCKSKGDILVVSVGNDKTIKQLKGADRPINSEKFRARMIASLAVVDYVAISEEFGKMDHNRFIEILRPDIFILNSTDSAISDKRELAESNGGKLLLCKRLPPGNKKGGISTTQIKKRLEK